MSSTDASGLIDTDEEEDLKVGKSKLSVVVKAKESKRPDNTASASPRSGSFRFKKRRRIVLAGSDSDSTFESKETKGNVQKRPYPECFGDENGVFHVRLGVHSNFAMEFPSPKVCFQKVAPNSRSHIPEKARRFPGGR